MREIQSLQPDQMTVSGGLALQSLLTLAAIYTKQRYDDARALQVLEDMQAGRSMLNFQIMFSQGRSQIIGLEVMNGGRGTRCVLELEVKAPGLPETSSGH